MLVEVVEVAGIMEGTTTTTTTSPDPVLPIMGGGREVPKMISPRCASLNHF